MTVSTTTAKVGYLGNGTTTVFAVPFVFFGASELEVTERVVATGVETVRALTTHYNVTGGNGSTGTVTAVAAPPATVTWTIARKTQRTQLTDYLTGDAFPAETHERALDRLTALVQEIEEILGRSLRIPITDTGINPQLPGSTGRANKVLVFDAAGAPGVSDASALASLTASAYVTVQEFTGTGSQLVFTLSNVPGSYAMVDVTIGGIAQSPSLDYSVLGNQLSFVDAPPNGMNIIARWMTSQQTVLQAGAVVAAASYTIAGVENTREVFFSLSNSQPGLRSYQFANSASSASMVHQLAVYGGAGNQWIPFGPRINFDSHGGSFASPLAIDSVSNLGALLFSGRDTTGLNNAVAIIARMTGNAGAGSLPASLQFRVAAAGGTFTNAGATTFTIGEFSVRFHPKTAPASPGSGEVYFDSGTNKLRCWNGTTWNDLF